MEKTVFDQILAGELPCEKVYEDEQCLAFHDINPIAPVHILVIPKTKLVNLNDVTEDHVTLLGHLLLAARKVAKIMDVENSGYRVIFNNGQHAVQTVSYMHCHVIGGRQLKG